MKWFKRIFKRRQAAKQTTNAMIMTPLHAKKMLMMIENTLDQELSCDEVHAMLDQYAEMALRGENPADLLPLVHHHLDMCPDCREEYEALVRMLEAPIEHE